MARPALIAPEAFGLPGATTPPLSLVKMTSVLSVSLSWSSLLRIWPTLQSSSPMKSPYLPYRLPVNFGLGTIGSCTALGA